MANPLRLKIQLRFNEQQALGDIQTQMNKLQSAVDKMQPKQNSAIKRTSQDIDNIRKSTAGATEGFKLFGVSASSAVTTMLRMAIVAPIMIALSRSIRDAFNVVKEIDTAMTNFKIVTNATSFEIAAVNARANEMSIALGRLKVEIIGSITEFARAGYSMEQSMKLAEVAISSANVGFTTLDKTTKFLIAGMKAFNIDAEDSARIMDVLFQVSNKTAITLEGIGEAFLRAGNSMKVAGATLEQTTAMIAAANESIQDPAKVGTALKTISARLRGIGLDGEAIPTLTNDFRALGIELIATDGSFRNIYDVFDDLALVFNDLSDIAKQNIIEKIAGKRQANILIGLLENWETAQTALNEALNSQGSVLKANEKYIDSIEGRLKKLKNTLNSLFEGIVSSGFVKLLVSALTGIISLLDILIVKVPILGAIVIGVLIKLNVLTAGLPVLIGSIVIAINHLSQTIGKFGNDTQKVAKQIDELNSKLNDIGSQIESLEALEELTDEQKKYLALLREQTEILKKEEIAKNQKLLQEELKKTVKEYELLNDVVSGVFYLEEERKKQALKSGLDKTYEYINDLQQVYNRNLEKELNLRDMLLKAQPDTDVYNEINKELEKTVQIQEKLVQMSKDVGGYIDRSISDDVDEVSTSLDKFKVMQKEVNDLLSTSVDRYNLLGESMKFLEESGYLTQDMVSKLSSEFAMFVDETGLNTNKMMSFFQSQMQGIKSLINAQETQIKSRIESNKILLQNLKVSTEIEKATIAEITKSYEALALSLEEVSDYYIRLRDLEKSELEITNISKEIKDLENSLVLVQNLNKEISAIGKTQEIVDIKEPMSELARALRDVNYELGIYQQKLGNTESEKEQLAIQSKLLKLTEAKRDLIQQQIAELEEESRHIKKNTAEYDDYIAKYQSLQSELLKTTIEIDKMNKATEEIEESNQEAINSLSELEKSLLSVNHEIEMHNRKLRQTDSIKETIALYGNLQNIYAKQTQLLREQKREVENLLATMSLADPAYNDLVRQNRELALALEDVAIKAKETADAIVAIREQAFQNVKDNSIKNLNKAFDKQFKEIEDRIKEVNKRMKEALKENDDKISQAEDTSALDLQKKALQEQLDALIESNRIRKETLALQKAEFEFQRRLAELNKKISESELEREMLMLDNSLESQRRRSVLSENITDLRAKREEEIRKKEEIDRERAIEEEYKSKEDLLRFEIDAINKQIEAQKEYAKVVRENSEEIKRQYESQLEVLQTQLSNAKEAHQRAQDLIRESSLDNMRDLTKSVTNLFRDMGDDITFAMRSAINSVIDDFNRAIARADDLRKSTSTSTSTTTNTGGTNTSPTRNLANQRRVINVPMTANANANNYSNPEDDEEDENTELNAEVRKWIEERKRKNLPINQRRYDNGGKLSKGDFAYNKNQNEEWVLTDTNLINIFEKGLTSLIANKTKWDIDNKAESTVGTILHIENQYNQVGSDVDVENLGKNQAKGIESILLSKGVRI